MIFLCSSPATAADTALSLGNYLSAQRNYDAAITEYKRFLFFQPDHSCAGEVYHKIGLAYRAQSLWTEGINALLTAVLHVVDMDTKLEYRLTLAVTLIANQNYDLAQLELIKVTMRAHSVPLYQHPIFLKAFAYLYQFRWQEAREALRNWTIDERLDSIFDAFVNMPQKSVKTARILSRILPGAAHIRSEYAFPFECNENRHIHSPIRLVKIVKSAFASLTVPYCLFEGNEETSLSEHKFTPSIEWCCFFYKFYFIFFEYCV